MNGPTQRVLSALTAVGCEPRKTSNGWECCCPSHNDTTPSLSIAVGKNGGAVLKCHRGCDTEALLSAIGLTLSDTMPDDPEPLAKKKAGGALGKIVATYDYTNADGKLLYQVVRCEPKTFRQRMPDGRGGWTWKKSGDVTLYRLRELLADPEGVVFIVEGEKDADSLARVGLLATTNAEGAGKWKHGHSELLRDRLVVVLPDNDDAGRNHARVVADSLSDVAASVKILELPGLPAKGDVSDWLAAGGTREQLEQLAAAAPAWQGDSLAAMRRSAAAARGIVPVGFEDRYPEPMEPEDASSGAVDDEDGDDIPTVEDPDYTPFPTHLLFGPMRDLVEAGAESIGCDPVYLGLPALVTAAGAIGQIAQVEVKPGWWVPPIIWGVVVGDSGTAKSPAFDLVTRPVDRVQREWVKVYQAELEQHRQTLLIYKKNLTAWKRSKVDGESPPEPPQQPTCQRCLVNDVTIEAIAPLLESNPRGLLLVKDELSSWFGSFDKYNSGQSSSDAGNWIQCYGARPVTVDRKLSGMTYVPRAAVSITGGIQPSILAKSLTAEHRASGLLARMQLAMPPRRPKHYSRSGVGSALLTEYQGTFETIFRWSMEPNPRTVRLSPGAVAIWEDWWHENASRSAPETDEWAAYLSKAEELPIRIALVLWFYRIAVDEDYNGDAIPENVMADAVQLARWFREETLRAYGALTENDRLADQQQAIMFLRTHGGVGTVRQVQQGCRRLRTSKKAKQTLESLAKTGKGIWEPLPNAPAGSPRRQCRLLDRITVTTSNVDRGDDWPDDAQPTAVQETGTVGVDRSAAGQSPTKADDPNWLLMEAAAEGEPNLLDW